MSAREEEEERTRPLTEEEATLAREGSRLPTQRPDPAEPSGSEDAGAESEMEEATERPDAAGSVEEAER